MKKVLLTLLALAVLIVVAAVALPFLVPVEKYKEQITAQVHDATGRDLVIGGDLNLSLLPSITLEANDVRFANAPGGTAPQMATLEKIVLAVKPLPLLVGSLEIESFRLVNPEINLEVDAEGTPNWRLATAPEAAAGEAPSGGLLRDIRFGDVRLEGGRLTYADARSGQRQELTGIDARVVLADFTSPLSVDGAFTWNGEKVELKIETSNLRALIEGNQSEVSVSLSSEPVRLRFQGELTLADTVTTSGDIELDVASVRRLADWAGQPVEMPGDGLGPLSIKGKLAFAGSTASFSEAEIRLDAIVGTGEIAVTTGGARPAIKGRLDVETLDLNPYLPPQPPPAETAAWDQQPSDLEGLKATDVDLALSAQAIKYRRIEIGRSALSIKLKDGRLVADLQQLELYQGQGTGRLVLDGSGATPAMDARFELSGVQAEPLLRAAADNDQLSGTLEIKLALKGTGRSQKDMVGTLAGSGNFKFADGTLKGVDLGAIAAKIEKVANTVQGGGANIMQSLGSGDMFGSFAALGAMFGGSGEVNQETKFTSLSGSYTVERGVATNRDLTMIGPLVNQRPLLRVQGDGTVNLPPRELAYRLDIRAFSQADQQRGVGGVVRLSGSMDSPDACVVVGSLCVGKETKPTDLISIEGIGKGVGGMLQKGPSLKAPGGAIGGLLGSKTGGVLGGVLGTGGAAPAPQPPAAAQPTAPAPQPKAPGGMLLDKLKGGFKLPGQ